MTKRFRAGKWLAAALIFGAVIFSLRALLEPGAIGNRFDWGLTLFDWQHALHGSLSSWDADYLGSAVGMNFGWLVSLGFGLFGWLTKLSVSVVIRIFLAGVLSLAGLGLTALLRQRRISWPIAIIAGVLYALSPTILIRMVLGYTSWLVAYAIMPWWLAAWWRMPLTKHPWRLGAAAVLLYAAMTSQPQFTIMALVLMVIDLLLPAPESVTKKRQLAVLAWSILTVVIVHASWLMIVGRAGVGGAVELNNAGSSLSVIQTLSHRSLATLIGADHNVNPVINIYLERRSFILPCIIVVLSAVGGWFSRRREARWALVVLGLIWPLSLGPSGFTGSGYIWLYQHLPFNNLFREVYHWSALLALALIVAAACFWQWLSDSRRIGRAAAVGLICLSAGYVSPFLKGQFFDYFGPQPLAAGYWDQRQAADELLATRTLFLPALGFIKSADYAPYAAANTDILALSTNRFQLPSQSSANEMPSSAYGLRNALLASWFNLPGAPDSALGYLKALGVERIVTRPRLVSLFAYLKESSLEADESVLADRWRADNFDVLTARQVGTPPLFKNDVQSEYAAPSAPLIALATRPVTAAFDWTAVNQSADAVFYLEDQSSNDRVQTFDRWPTLASADDWIAAHISEYNQLSDFAFDAGLRPAEGWTAPGAVWWRSAGLAAAREPYAFTRSAHTLSATVASAQNGPLVVRAKVWESARSQSITVTVNGSATTIETNQPDSAGSFRWEEVGVFSDLPQSFPVVVGGAGEVGVAQLLFVPEEAWNSWKQKYEQIDKEPPVQVQGEVSYSRLSMTKFQVKLQLDREGWLLVREGYDPGWQLQLGDDLFDPVKVNGYAMAFRVPGGSYDGQLIFRPQRLYSWTLAGSLLWLGGLLLVAVGGGGRWGRRRRRRPIEL